MKILVINPGSTSTKVGIFEDTEPLVKKTLRHSKEELEAYATLSDQIPFRRKLILHFLKENKFELSDIDGFIGRGGLTFSYSNHRSKSSLF